LKKAVSEKQIAILHGHDISFWSQDTFRFTHKITLNNPCSKVVFEKSNRYLAGLTEVGGVEVWSIKGAHETHHWDLNFNSVGNIEVPNKENQFFILMNSEDKIGEPQETILLFQFSRPQNLVQFWKLLLPIKCMQFFEMKKIGILLLTAEGGSMQKIYCGVTKQELSEKKR
jgi:hypothetical protein